MIIRNIYDKIIMSFGGLAQLARAPALHAGGRGFESHILHQLTINLVNARFLFCQNNLKYEFYLLTHFLKNTKSGIFYQLLLIIINDIKIYII